MDLPRFRDEVRYVDEDVVDAIEHAIRILSEGSDLPPEWMDRPLEGGGPNRECHVGKGLWMAYHTKDGKLVLVGLIRWESV